MTTGVPGPPAQHAPVKHPHAASRVFDGEAFIVLPQFHEYKILNATGTRIWNLIDGARTESDIAQIIADEYEVTLATALEDVTSFVRDLRTNGMLAGGSPREPQDPQDDEADR